MLNFARWTRRNISGLNQKTNMNRQQYPTSSGEQVPAAPDFSCYQSLRRCLVGGWKVFAKHPARYLRGQWLWAMFRSLGLTALLLYATQIYAEHILPAYLFWKMGATEHIEWGLVPVPGRTWACLGLCVVVVLVLLYLSKGNTWSQTQRFTATGLTGARPTIAGKGMAKNALRCFVVDVLFTLVNVGFIGLVVWLSYKTSWWWLLLLVPIECAVYVFSNICRCGLLVAHVTPVRLLAWGWAKGKRGGGGYFLLLLLTGIPYLLLCAVLLLPLVIFTFAILANGETLLTGAQSGLPAYFPYLYFAVSTICLLFASVFASLRLWPLAMKTCYLVQSGPAAVQTEIRPQVHIPDGKVQLS